MDYFSAFNLFMLSHLESSCLGDAGVLQGIKLRSARYSKESYRLSSDWNDFVKMLFSQ